jgi:hypothetical protein
VATVVGFLLTAISLAALPSAPQRFALAQRQQGFARRHYVGSDLNTQIRLETGKRT